MKKLMIIKDQKGAAIVEFAIVLPLLVIFAFGICEFGLMWYNTQVIVNASREGARAGIARVADADDSSGSGLPLIADIVNAYCDSRLVTFGGSTVPITSFPNGDDNMDNTTKYFGIDFSVEVTYNYTSLFGAGPSLQLKRRTLMKMEQIPS